MVIYETVTYRRFVNINNNINECCRNVLRRQDKALVVVNESMCYLRHFRLVGTIH